MIRFSKTSPGVFDWMLPMVAGSRPSMPTRRSTTPPVPKDVIDLPVRASTSCSRLSIAKIRRRSLPSAFFPVVEAAAGHAIHVFADPQLLAAGGIDGDQRAIASAPVDHAAHHDGSAAGIAEGIGPGDLQLRDIGLVDLARGEVARVVRAIAVAGPPAVGGSLCAARMRRSACRRRRRAAAAMSSQRWRREGINMLCKSSVEYAIAHSAPTSGRCILAILQAAVYSACPRH